MPFSGQEVSEKGFPQGWDADADSSTAQRIFRVTQLLEAMVTRDWSWDRFNSLGLRYSFHGGLIDNGLDGWVLIADGSVTLANDATNFIERSDAGVVSVNQSGFTYLSSIPMAQIDTRSENFLPTTYTDRRPSLGVAPSGVSGGTTTFPQIIGLILDSQVPLSAVAQWESFLSIAFTQLTGVATKAQLPSTIAYEDETNTFDLLQTFSAGISIADGQSISWSDVSLFRDSANVLKTDDSFEVGGQLLIADGTEGLPGFALSDTPSTGIRNVSSSLTFVRVGTDQMSLRASGPQIVGNDSYGWVASTSNVGGTPDLTIFRDDPDTHAWRRGTNAQISRLYGRFVGDTDFERLEFITTAGDHRIQTAKGAVGGMARDLVLGTDSITAVTIDASTQDVTVANDLIIDGQLQFGADVNLFRDSADVLKTDDSLVVGGTIVVNNAGPHAIGVSTQGQHSINLGGSYTTTGGSTVGSIVNHRGNLTAQSGSTVRLMGTEFSVSIFTQTATESVDIIAQAHFNEPDITNNLTGGGTIALAAAIAIDSEPTEGILNAALAIDAGQILFGRDTNLFRDSANVLKTDDDFVCDSFSALGALFGALGASPVAQTAAYTPTNVTPDRSYDANSTTIDELADVLGTMIADIQTFGFFG